MNMFFEFVLVILVLFVAETFMFWEASIIGYEKAILHITTGIVVIMYFQTRMKNYNKGSD